jgi:CRP-like cAMP-binding protein
MLTIYEQTETFSALNQRSKDLAREIYSTISPTIAPALRSVKIRSGERVDLSGATISIIREGLCRVSQQGKSLAFLDAGDIVGWAGQFPPDTNVFAETDVSIERYEASSLGAVVETGSNLSPVWAQYLEVQRQLIWELVNQFASAAPKHSLRLRSVAPGQAIIIQDTPQGNIFLLIGGNADVYVGETRVGEVLTGEIFGALNQVGDAVRTASVVARCECIVAEFEQDEFRRYLMLYPHFAQKMLSTMSRVIVSQNQKIVTMTN